jgi:hypothetical protein
MYNWGSAVLAWLYRSSIGDHRGKGPLHVATSPSSDAESDDEADMNVYLNMAMFVTRR